MRLWALGEPRVDVRAQGAVSIPVLMDEALGRARAVVKGGGVSRLNPCFDG
jgi:hypothetical protein